MKYAVLILMIFAGASELGAQVVRDDFNRAATSDLTGSEKWRKVLDLTDPSASMQINGDSTISPFNPLGPNKRGAVYWDSLLTGRFQVGVILRHKSGSNNIPVFHLHLMNDSSWFTGDGYGLRFQENSGTDRFDIQRLTGSGTDTPFVSLLGTVNTEFSAGDTLMFKFFEDGRKTAVRYGIGGSRDSVSVIDTAHNPAGWFAWVQAVVFTDSVKLDNFMLGPIPYGISASAGPGGAISPVGNVLVDAGGDTSFTFTPDPGFGVFDVLVDSVSVGNPAGYTFTAVGADHTIEALFDTLVYTITASASPLGSITPSGPVIVNHGTSSGFTLSPDPGCHLDSIIVDGIPVDSTASFTFDSVTADHTIAAYFSFDVYTITATAGPGGSISPSGAVPVNSGTDQAFVVTPNAGYHLDSLLVDGLATDSIASYTLYAVIANHTISAFFSINIYTITASAGVNGSISPSGAVPVSHGATQAFTTLPDPGFFVDSMFVDGSPVDSLTSFTFTTVNSVHTISVTFSDEVIAMGTYPVRENWNIVSVPLGLPDFSKTSIYPDASSGAYAYSGGYVGYDTLTNGPAYWLKFPADDSVSMTGLLRAIDTVNVGEGWNMVGSISTSVPIANVISIPGGLVSSGFFAYEGSYVVSPTIEPGRGYWVKMNGSGQLVISGVPAASPATALRIVPTADYPPSPPGVSGESRAGVLPTAFSLSQNYPNPFNPSTRIEFSLPVGGYARLTVFNVLGEEVARPVDGEETAGLKSVSFDAGGLPSGVYTYRLVSGEFVGSARMLLLK